MATTKSKDVRKSLSEYYLYVPLGAGQLIFQKARSLTGKAVSAAQHRRKSALELYQDLARRGEKLAASVRRAPYTQRAVSQTKAARSQVKAAATSIRKAALASTEATREAAKKVV